MSLEKGFRKYVGKGLREYGSVRQVENAVRRGTPDTNYLIDGTEGWIELKYAHTWPVYDSTPLRMLHFSGSQKLWAEEQLKHGGLWWLFLKVGSDYVLLKGEAGLCVGATTKSALMAACEASWSRRIDFKQLAGVLKK